MICGSPLERSRSGPPLRVTPDLSLLGRGRGMLPLNSTTKLRRAKHARVLVGIKLLQAPTDLAPREFRSVMMRRRARAAPPLPHLRSRDRMPGCGRADAQGVHAHTRQTCRAGRVRPRRSKTVVCRGAVQAAPGRWTHLPTSARRPRRQTAAADAWEASSPPPLRAVLDGRAVPPCPAGLGVARRLQRCCAACRPLATELAPRGHAPR